MPELQPITPRILVTTDFSDDSLLAFHHALAVAVAKRARLTLLHTGSESRDEVPWEQFPGVRETLASWGTLGADAPRSAVAEQLGIDVAKMAMRDDDPRQGIVDYLRRHPVDLLVMATRGRSGMARILRPSVAETVAYRTRSHSLLLSDQATGFVDGQSGVASLKQVLCVLDPYQDPRPALAFLRSWLPALGAMPAEVTVVDTGNGDVFDERQLPQIEGQTWALRRQLGDIAEVAIELADQAPCDLVVITGQGRLGLRARLAGSNTERILRATRLPVLIMPGG